jgi:hypothetical protein
LIISSKKYPKTFGNLGYFFDLYYVIKNKDMMKAVQLPDSFNKGLIVDVNVSKDGKKSSKQLKVCSVKTRSVLFIEVDKENRKNIFRKVNRKDVVEFRPTAICEITIRDGVLPEKWESSWDAIGSYSPMTQSKFGTRNFSNHSNGWAPKLPSTTNSTAGFPMV